jgi:protocatechuate 3,4-dioxygenase beta subunit
VWQANTHGRYRHPSDADHGHRLLLRTRGERPSDRQGAKYNEQFAPFHQYTPSGQGMANAKPITSHAATRLGDGSLP